tara:strand:- start:292 stop:465 length:174 start_codon:yes stop_codon:yes gene_type:complete
MNNNISTIKQSAAELLERLKQLDPDERYSLLEEVGSWWFTDIDLEDELFIPDWGKIK